MDTLEFLIKEIKNYKNILITTHQNPDGDGIGAGIALLLGLKKLYSDKEINFVIDDIIPNNLKFLSGSELILKIDDIEKIKNIDLIISLDAASIERIGKIKSFKNKIPILNIDHHISNDSFGEFNYIDVDSASTSEIIFTFLEKLNINFNLAIGEALYVGIVNDTGNFKHSNVSKETFLKASKLIEIGVNNTKIIENFYDNKSMGALKLLSRAIENIKYNSQKGLVYSLLTQEDFNEFNGNKADTDGIVETLLMLNEAKISLFLREEENGNIKGSMRTKLDSIDLNFIASSFKGGGHKKAAGFSTNLSKKEIVEKILYFL
ncbi:MAG: DHH family phosphoesterase [Fusobacteriaceae bacterium]